MTSATTNAPRTAVLPAVLSSRYALTWPQAAVCAAFSALYLLLSYLPLFHAITWRHVQSGDWIVAHRLLPKVDPTLPLADGFRAAPTAWLSDVLLSRIWHLAGLQGLSSALALVFVGLLALTYVVFSQRAGRLLLAVAATALVLGVHWTRISILRPEWLGLAACMLLLLGLTREAQSSTARSWRAWLAEAALFLAWANLDGSVVLGVLLLAALAVARCVDALRERRSLRAALQDERWRQAVYRAELAAVVSLCQPLGVTLWTDFVQNTRASVWWSLGGYSPLVLTTVAGGVMLALWALGAALLRWSDRPVTAEDVVLAALASLIVIVNRQALVWGVPLLLWVLLPHLAAALERTAWLRKKIVRPEFAEGEPVPPLAFAFSALALLSVWCGFALSPLANPVFGGRPRPTQRMVTRQTPLAVAEFFKQRSTPPHGLVWTPEDWGDWLSLTGPVGLQISANSQLHLLSDRQKYDILLVSRAEGNWTRTLDRYGVEWLVIDKERQPRLFDAALAQRAEWSVGYEDAQAAVLQRRKA